MDNSAVRSLLVGEIVNALGHNTTTFEVLSIAKASQQVTLQLVSVTPHPHRIVVPNSTIVRLGASIPPAR